MQKKDKKIERVVVTGAAGAVGSYLHGALVEAGYRVRGVDIRSPVDSASWEEHGSEFLVGDLTDPGFVTRSVDGMDAVIHAAALLDIALDYEALAPLNVVAVRDLYRAAAKAGAVRFVHFSSGSVYAPSDGSPVEEDHPLMAKSAYERTKVESEEILKELYFDLGLDWIVLRPGLIYGPGGRFLVSGIAAVPPIMRWLLGEGAPALKGGPRTNLVHAEDVARAAVFLMQGAAPQRAYNVADPTPLDFGTIATAAMRSWGMEPKYSISIPEPESLRPLRPLLDSGLFFKIANLPIGSKWKELVHDHGLAGHLHPALDRETAPYMFNHTIFSVERLRVRGFVWKHPDFRSSIGGVLRWYEDHRWIPRISEIEPGTGRLPRVGFSFQETMQGSVQMRVDAPHEEAGMERPFVFTVTASAPRFESFLRNWRTAIEGTVDWEGIADKAAVKGTLEMPLVSRRQLIYDFEFKGNDGLAYRFKGQKDVDIRHFLETMTRLPGTVVGPDGKEVASGIARFDLRKDLRKMVASFSLV